MRRRMGAAAPLPPNDTPAGVVLATGDAAAGRAIVAPDPRDAIEPPTPVIVADEVQTQAEQVDSLDARANFMLMEGSFAFLMWHTGRAAQAGETRVLARSGLI